jgi:hypothetical protein
MPKKSSKGRAIDKWYQFFYGFTATSAGAADLARAVIPLPTIPTQYVGAGSSLVYEILWIEYNLTLPNTSTHNEIQNYVVGLMLNDRTDILAIYPSDPNVIDFRWMKRDKFVVGTDGGGQCYVDLRLRTDMEDNLGNGRLIARDNLYLFAYHLDTDAASEISIAVDLKVAYRLTKIPLTEYIGLLGEQSYSSR